MYYIKLIIIGFFLTIPASIFASDVSVSSSGTVASGETVTLTLAVNNITDLFSTAFDIQYDPTVISFVSAQKGTFLEQGGGTTTLLTSANNGVLIVGYSRQAVGGVSTGVNGSGNVMTLTFTALANGTSNISFLNNALCSSAGFICTEIPATWNNTAVTVSGTGTPLDTTLPTVTITEPAGGATVSRTITITATANDNVGVAGVQIKQNSVNIGGEDASLPYSVSLDTTSLGNGVHSLTAVARDTAGNTATSNAITITVNNIVSDTTAPSIPINLSATAVSASQVNLSWLPSTDNTAVTGYRIYRNGTQLTTTTGTTYSNTGLSPSTIYSYTVLAYDASGNSSAQSTSVSATTQAQTQVTTDTTAPVVTSFSIPNTSSSLTVAVSSFVATDAQGVTGYKITETSSAPSSSDTGWSSSIPSIYVFASAGSKNLYAWAKDSAENISTEIQASVLITLPTTTQTTNNNTQTPVTTQQNTTTTTTNPVQSNTGTQTITTISSNTTAQPTFTAGCSSGFAFITTTGKPCGSTTSTLAGGTTPSSPAISPSVSPTSSYLFSNERLITYGMKNNTDVRELQKVLQREGVLSLSIPADGAFGPITKTAVITFQKKYSINPPQGYVGPLTKAKLNELYGATVPSTTPVIRVNIDNTSSSFFFSRNLTIGSRGEDVQKLQQILNSDPATRISQTGAGSPGNETTYFGPATKNAVVKYQQKQGIVPASGYVGPLTRNKLNNK